MPYRFTIIIFAASIFFVCSPAATLKAQFANTTLQLPTFRVTQFNSSFSVPDGGTINLGGVGSSRSFRGGRSRGRGNAQASARVLIMKELEQEMLSVARPAIIKSNFAQQQLNGSAQTQAKADFITGNINRR